MHWMYFPKANARTKKVVPPYLSYGNAPVPNGGRSNAYCNAIIEKPLSKYGYSTHVISGISISYYMNQADGLYRV